MPAGLTAGGNATLLGRPVRDCATRVARYGRATLLLALALCAALNAAPRRISLSELGKRNNTDFSPLYLGQQVAIRGVVSLGAIHVNDYALVAIQDGEYGAVLKLALAQTFV